jgi:hypothetical protein
MSTQAFDRKFTKPLLKKLDAEARKAVTRQRGQLLILADTKELQQVIEAATGHRPKAAHLAKALKQAQTHAKKLQSNFKTRNKRRYNAIVAKVPDIRLPYTLNKDMFIVSSFSRSITTIKNTMLKTLVAEGAISDAESKTVSKNLHKGHGAKGNAVSQVQIASSVAGLDAPTKKLLLYNLEGAFRSGRFEGVKAFRDIKRLVTNAEQIVTKQGKLTANYVSVIAFQSGKDNIKESSEEKALKAIFREFVSTLSETGHNSLLNMEGSSTLKEKALAAVTENFKGKKYLKVKSKSVKLKTKTKSKTTSTKTSASVALTARRIKTRKKKEKAKASAASQPLAMVAMINKELPETVRKNMDSPGLVNRTGRFAESVRVTDVIQTPKGFPSFGYKYQMNPYQVFEDGGNGSAPWANGNRDPRGLIDRSIREIAKDLAIGRFYTRRV